MMEAHAVITPASLVSQMDLSSSMLDHPHSPAPLEVPPPSGMIPDVSPDTDPTSEHQHHHQALEDAIVKRISVIIAQGDPHSLTIKQIRTSLQEEFGDCVATVYKERVIAAIKEEIQNISKRGAIAPPHYLSANDPMFMSSGPSKKRKMPMSNSPTMGPQHMAGYPPMHGMPPFDGGQHLMGHPPDEDDMHRDHMDDGSVGHELDENPEELEEDFDHLDEENGDQSDGDDDMEDDGDDGPDDNGFYPNGSRKRRKARFTAEEQAYLLKQRDEEGVDHNAASAPARARIGTVLNMSLERVTNWFRNHPPSARHPSQDTAEKIEARKRRLEEKEARDKEKSERKKARDVKSTFPPGPNNNMEDDGSKNRRGWPKGRPRGSFTRFTAEQVSYLWDQLMKGVTVNKSSAEQRQQIAEHLKVPIEKVTNWFRNNRLTKILRNSNEPTIDDSGHGSSDSDDIPPLQAPMGAGMVHGGMSLPGHMMNPMANGLMAHPHAHPLALVGPAAVASHALQHAMPPGVGRVSSRFTKEEVAYLKEQRDKYGVTHMASSLFDRMRIANFLAVSLQKVNNWFQNNRVRNIDPGEGHSDHEMSKVDDPIA